MLAEQGLNRERKENGMSELKYKGIDLKKIKEVQEVHNDKLPTPMRIEHIDFDEMMQNIAEQDAFKSIQREVARIQKQIEEDARRTGEAFDIVIICEMAKRFLEQEIEKYKAGAENG